MIADAMDLLAAVPGELGIGVGLDYGPGVRRERRQRRGEGLHRDRRRREHRLQACAADGEIVVSSRVMDVTDAQLPGAEPRSLDLKGKTEPVPAFVLKTKRASAADRLASG